MSGFYGNTYSAVAGLQIDKKYPNRAAMDDGAAQDGVFVNRYVMVEYDLEDNYAGNYSTDAARYGKGNHRFRGYDSTIWQKTFVNGAYSYVNVGDLNGITPVFELKIDPPSDEPKKPHFDTTGTNIHYALHLQPSWGMRVAHAKDSQPSDFKEGDTKLAISFNKSWLNKDKQPESIYIKDGTYYNYYTNKTTTLTSGTVYRVYDGANSSTYTLKCLNEKNSLVACNNVITLENEESGTKYNYYNDADDDGIEDPGETGTQRSAPDIKGLKIQLPIIGDVIAQVYDILRGPKRNNDPSESLQGMLYFFQGKTSGDDAGLGAGQIPIKGTDHLIGVTPTGNSWIDVAVGDTTLTISHKDGKVSATDGTTLDLKDFYTYDATIDTAGHVTKLEKRSIVLPNNFIGVGVYEQSEAETSPQSGEGSVDVLTPDRRDDWITIATDNKWVRICAKEPDAANKLLNSTIYVGHETHDIKPSDTDQAFDLNTNASLSFPIVSYDNAGHITGTQNVTIAAPNIFKNIKVLKNDETGVSSPTRPSADVTLSPEKFTDNTLTLETANKWIAINADTDNDKLTFGHSTASITNKTSTVTLGNTQSTFTATTFGQDDAGHISGDKEVTTYTLPNNFGNISLKNYDDSEPFAQVSADAVSDTFSLIAGNKWLELECEDDAITLKHAVFSIQGDGSKDEAQAAKNFSIPWITHDDAGHITGQGSNDYYISTFSGLTGDNMSMESSDGFFNPDFAIEGDGHVSTELDISGTKVAFTINHNAPTEGTQIYDMTEECPENMPAITLFPGTEYCGLTDLAFDDVGHMYDMAIAPIKLPQWTEESSGLDKASEVIVGFNVDEEDETIQFLQQTPGTLVIGETGLSITDSTKDTNVLSSDTINEAFSKLQNLINEHSDDIENIKDQSITIEADQGESLTGSIKDVLDAVFTRIVALEQICQIHPFVLNETHEPETPSTGGSGQWPNDDTIPLPSTPNPDDLPAEEY